jgi:PAS domain S-box-containing protein
MAADEDEEELLRSVALQNAQSILLARQKAEEDVVRAKEALELRTGELARSLAMMRATLESTTDGILVTGDGGQVTGFNQKYLRMWRLPQELVDSANHRDLMVACGRQFDDPRPYLARTNDIYASSQAESEDVFELADGRVLERFSRIQVVDGKNVGRVWSFRDVTDRRRADEALREQVRFATLRAEIGTALAERQGLQAVLQRCSELLARHLDMALARVWTLNDTEGVLELQGSAGIYTHRDGPHGRITVGQLTIGRIAQECRPHLSNSLRDDARVSDQEWVRKEGMVGFAGYPLLIDGRCVGVMAVFARHALSDVALADLAPLADGIAQCVERKQAEAALRTSEARKTAILETALDSIITCDREGSILEFNPAAETTFGFRRADVIGRNMADLIVPGHLRDRQRQGMAHYLATGEERMLNRRVEATAVRCDGAEFPIELSVTRISGDGPPMFTAYLRDITDRKLAEQALHNQSEWLRVTLSSIGDAVVTTDAEGQVTFLNGVAEMLTGWPAADAVGLPLPDVFRIVNERTRQEVENPAIRALRDGIVVGLANHTILIMRDGTERPIDDSAAPMRDASGRIVGAVLVFRDITERQRAEAERENLLRDAKESEERLRLALDAGGTGVWDWDVAAGRITWSDRVDAFFSMLPGEFDNSPDMFTRCVHPEDIDRVKEALRASVEEDAPYLIEYRIIQKGGAVRWLNTAGTVFRDATGHALRMIGAITDVTVRRDAEEELREASRKKDEFLALLAHELRNPLAPLRNGLQVMRLSASDANAVAQARAMMDRQLGHMVRLIDDLLDVSRIGRQKMELRQAQVALADVVDNAVETARPVIEAAGHRLTVLLPSEAVFLNADLTRLAQVLSNLLTNSAKYTKREGEIWLVAERRGDQVVISVRDTGIGIPAEALPRVFDMFAQVDRSIERATGGLGIGLALVKGLVEMHGGSVTAESDGPGKGSVFTVRLPAWAGTAAPEPAASPENDRPSATVKRRILVVDDNQDSAQTMSRLLKLLGHEVRTAYDGLEAIDAAKEFGPEVALMDVGMPRLNGYEAARRIRQQVWGTKMIIIALTGWGQEGDRAQSRDAGCNGHLVKPVNLAELERLLEKIETTERRTHASPGG